MIRHIVALDSQRGIAKDGVQPWKLPIDERYFYDQTMSYGGVVLMGRKTFNAIGRALPQRDNYVLTHDPNFRADGVSVVTDLAAFLSQHTDIWIIGGRELYELTLDYADELYITAIKHDYECDVQYPAYDNHFKLVSESDVITEQGVQMSFQMYLPSRI